MPTTRNIVDPGRTRTYNQLIKSLLVNMKTPRPETPQAQAELDSILTIPEVCSAYYVTPSAVRYWISRGYIQARHATVWLISASSLQAYRGPAPNVCARAQHTRPRL